MLITLKNYQQNLKKIKKIEKEIYAIAGKNLILVLPNNWRNYL